jgi:hypothetical protein
MLTCGIIKILILKAGAFILEINMPLDKSFILTKV